MNPIVETLKQVCGFFFWFGLALVLLTFLLALIRAIFKQGRK